MKLSVDAVRDLARERGMSLTAALHRAGVSRTAYYSLTRRPSVLPGTVHALADLFGVPASTLLTEVDPSDAGNAERRLAEALTICAEHPDATFENVWHTLCLLDLPPAERLNRSLTRGRAAAVH
jgi:hypothetical protein